MGVTNENQISTHSSMKIAWNHVTGLIKKKYTDFTASVSREFAATVIGLTCSCAVFYWYVSIISS